MKNALGFVPCLIGLVHPDFESISQTIKHSYSLQGWRMLGKGRVKKSSYFSSTCFPCTNLSDSEFLQNIYEEVSSINIQLPLIFSCQTLKKLLTFHTKIACLPGIVILLLIFYFCFWLYMINQDDDDWISKVIKSLRLELS